MTRSRELAELATAYDTGTPLGFRNRLINSDMRIDQRNAGASVTPVDGQYLTDRWVYSTFAASKFTAQQNAGAVTPPVGFVNYLGLTSTSAYSIPAGEFTVVRQRVEGFNIADLGWGTANAKAVTLSFKVYSSLTGTFGGALNNSGNSRSYPFSYTVSSANTWTDVSVTIAGDTSGTWLTTNGIGIQLSFSLGSGSTYSNTAGAWAAGNYQSATGAVDVIATSGATFYITGVQLEAGSVATPFERRPYGTELALCQRYCIRNFGSVTGFSYSAFPMFVGQFFQQMRAAPSAVFISGVAFTSTSGGQGNYTPTGANFNDITAQSIRIDFTGGSWDISVPNGNACIGTPTYLLSAEL